MDRTAVGAADYPPSHAVAAEFRAELARQRLSQRQFAAKLGVPNGWVARRLTLFEAAITIDDAYLMAKALRRPVDQFVLPRLDSNQQPFGYGTQTNPRRRHLQAVR